MKNNKLHKAKATKNDEFYTQLSDIEKELVYYKEFFKGKVVYCNCDNAQKSNFFKYFMINFDHFELKKLIATEYCKGGHGMVYVCENDKKTVTNKLKGNGDFRSNECVEFLKQSDVVVTNPPFSLFREYVKQLMNYDKKFLIIGNKNAITFKEIFPYIKDNKLWCGVRPFAGGMWFIINNETDCNVTKIENGQLFGNTPSCWFTNIPHDKCKHPLVLHKKYSPEKYPKYDNYDAIDVGKVSDIPMDYDGFMGVPITFLDKYCFSQFKIVDARNIGLTDRQRNKTTMLIKDVDSAVNGKPTYARICIKRIFS